MKKKPKASARMSLKKYKRNDSITVERTFRWFHWAPSTTATVDFWSYFQPGINQLPNVAEYTALFDQYRVNSLTFKLVPRYDNFAGNDTTDTTLVGVTNQAGVRVHVVIDPSSTVTPSGGYSAATLNAFLENGKCRTYMGNDTVTFTVKYPMIQQDVNNTTLSEFKRSSFFSTSNTGIPIRGAHVFLQDINLTGVFGNQYDVFCTMNVTFKGQK